MKIVVYTAAFGEKFGFVPQKKEKGIDYICYTDDLSKVPKSWQGVLMDDKEIKVNSLKNRCLKLLPHLHLKEYDFSVYIDSNFLIVGSIKKAIKEMEGYPMGVFDHNQASDKRDCVYDEYEAIVELGAKRGKYKDNPVVMKKQIDYIKSQGYPKNNGLVFAGVLLRKHNNKEVISLMEQWWEFVSTMSKRDQLSFDFLRWKNNFERYVFQGDLRKNNEYFYNLGRNRRNYWKKIFQYRLKTGFNYK